MRTRTYLRHIGVLIAVGTMVVSTLSATASAAPTAPTALAAPGAARQPAAAPNATIDDSDTQGSNRFTYSRGWKVCGQCDRAALNGSFHYSNRVGATVTLTFRGRRASIYGFTQRAGGRVAVSVDGRSAGVVNLASRGRRSYASFYATPWLRDGSHTVRLTVLRRTTGRGRIVIVDKAVVVRGGEPRPGQPRPKPTPPPGGGVASLTFDDGRIGQFTDARPVLNSAGVKATFFIISDALTWGSSNMSASQVRDLANDGHEIGNHSKTHAHLTTLSQAGVDTEFADSNATIKNAVGVTPTVCAYPYGESNDTVRAVAAKHFTACRGTNGGVNTASGLDRYDLRTFYVTTGTTAAQVRDAAASAKASKAWIIFIYHGIGTTSTNDDVTTQSFTDQLAAIRGTGIPIRTVSAALGAPR